MKNRVVFSGKAYSGKTTGADYLNQIFGYKKLAFADILKKVCEEVFFMKSKDRSLLQNVGTALRNVRREVFVDYLEQQIHDTPDSINLVIDDLRYTNEYNMLRGKGFTTVRLVVVPEILKQRAWTKDKQVMYQAQLEHPSECNLDEVYDFTFMISNNDTLELFYSKLDEILECRLIDRIKAHDRV